MQLWYEEPDRRPWGPLGWTPQNEAGREKAASRSRSVRTPSRRFANGVPQSGKLLRWGGRLHAPRNWGIGFEEIRTNLTAGARRAVRVMQTAGL